MNDSKITWQHRLIHTRWGMGAALVLLVWMTGGHYSPLLPLPVLLAALLALLLDSAAGRRYAAGLAVLLAISNVLPGQGNLLLLLLHWLILALTLGAAAVLPPLLIAPLRQREQELTALTDEHSRTVNSLQQAETQRTQFVRVVTHELRSPVVASQSLLRVLLANLGGTLSDQQRDILARVNGRMDALLTLINDLLSLAAASHQPDQPLQPLDIAVLLAEQADTWRYQAQDKQQTITFETRPQSIVIRADDSGMRRIFENLIGNAIKYTPPGGMVRVSLSVREAQALLRVQDSGIGIPPEALPQIGEEFFRAPNAKQSGILGTGLGLAAVRQLVQRFEGKMQVDSVVGQGTTFTLIFPLR